MDINVFYVDTDVILDNLYDSDAICLLGLIPEAIPDYINWLTKEAGVKLKEGFVLYHTDGARMNNYCHLVGDRYMNDLNIYLISMNDVENLGNLPLMRLQIDGLKWFKDVVDNNRRGA